VYLLKNSLFKIDGFYKNLKKNNLKQRGFQFLSGRGINDTNAREF